MNKKKQMVVVLFCIIFASTNFIAIFTQPIVSPVIVTFGNTRAEIASIEVLQTEYPDAITVQYGSLDYYLIKGRCFGPMVYVGHGTGDSIGNADARQIILDIKTSPAPYTYLLSCGSNEIANIELSRNIVGFGQVIDADMGALVVALRIAVDFHMVEKVESIFDQFLEIARGKISGQIPILPLAYFSNAERDHFLGALLLSIGIAILGPIVFSALAQRFSLAAAAAANTAATGVKAAIKRLVIYFATHGGVGSVMTGINILFGGVFAFATQLGPTFVTFINIAVNSMNIFEWMIWIALTAVEIAVIVLTATAALWIRIAASLGIALFNVGAIGWTDYWDANGTPCGSLLEAISQLT
ncbi:MAG: hypothetical protein ACFFF9_16475 [Candidatus Thorarchaeota archaeon]